MVATSIIVSTGRASAAGRVSIPMTKGTTPGDRDRWASAPIGMSGAMTISQFKAICTKVGLARQWATDRSTRQSKLSQIKQWRFPEATCWHSGGTTCGKGPTSRFRPTTTAPMPWAPHYQETRNTFDLDFIHHLTLGARHNFIWGLGARLSPSQFVQTVPTLDLIPHDFANNVFSGFVQDEIAIVPNKFSLTVGSKLEHNDYTGFEFQPSIRGLWTITPRQTFWAGGHARRPDSLPHRRRLSSHRLCSRKSIGLSGSRWQSTTVVGTFDRLRGWVPVPDNSKAIRGYRSFP